MRRIATVLLALLVLAPAAHATFGGPTEADVLGYESRTRRAYFLLTSRNESGEPARLYYFDLAGKLPAAPVRVPWPQGDDLLAVDRVQSAAIARLVRTLQKLPEVSASPSRVPLSAPVPYDSVRCGYGQRCPRWVAEVVSGEGAAARRPRIVTLKPSSEGVRELRRMKLPGGRGWIVVWSAVLDPWEGGYEMQLPVLLGDPRGRPDPIAPEAYGFPR